MKKDAARKEAFARRKAAKADDLDAAAQVYLRDALQRHRGTPLAGYMPIRTEVDPVPVMAEWDAPVGVPVIQGEAQPLVFHRWTPECEMMDGPFGAQVPKMAEEVVPKVLIVPLVAFDQRGYRLGYGGGFYDRTLELLRKRGPVTAIGFAFEAQAVAEVPIEPTDQRLDAMVTDQGVSWFGG